MGCLFFHLKNKQRIEEGGEFSFRRCTLGRIVRSSMVYALTKTPLPKSQAAQQLALTLYPTGADRSPDYPQMLISKAGRAGCVTLTETARRIDITHPSTGGCSGQRNAGMPEGKVG